MTCFERAQKSICHIGINVEVTLRIGMDNQQQSRDGLPSFIFTHNSYILHLCDHFAKTVLTKQSIQTWALNLWSIQIQVLRKRQKRIKLICNLSTLSHLQISQHLFRTPEKLNILSESDVTYFYLLRCN